MQVYLLKHNPRVSLFTYLLYSTSAFLFSFSCPYSCQGGCKETDDDIDNVIIFAAMQLWMT